METNRYFILKPVVNDSLQNTWVVQTYLNPAQAAHDFIRAGGLVDKSLIFAMEQPVSLRINNATVNFEQPKEEVRDETEPEDKATQS